VTSDKESSSDEAFEAASRPLYRERPEDFVAARNRAVREARARGERDLATRLAALRRPNQSLWLANRLHEVAPHQLKNLLAVAGQMRAAQARAARGDAAARKQFRELITSHSQLIEELVRAGLSFAEENGQGAGEEVGRRLAATLRAASAEPEEGGRRLAEGRLLADLEPAGFGLQAGAPAPSITEAGEASRGEEPSETAEAAETAETVQARAATFALEAAARAGQARRTAAERERAAVAARTRADELARKASALAREAAKAREEAEAAELQAAAAEREAADARRAAQEAAADARRR
jgi:hypothetical protein